MQHFTQLLSRACLQSLLKKFHFLKRGELSQENCFKSNVSFNPKKGKFSSFILNIIFLGLQIKMENILISQFIFFPK